jgi:hemerythrin-like domain-containing protein
VAGPMQMYLYVHDAILREVARLEERAKGLDRDDADDVAAMAGDLTWFHATVKGHELTEERVLFPALDERITFVAETYAYDHEDFEPHVWSGLRTALDGLEKGGSTGERREMAELLYRQSVALHEHMRLHISKENELLLPKLEAEFDVDEQARLAGAMAGLIEPPMMGGIVAWMYAGQDAQDREGMVRFLMRILPPPALEGICGMLAAKEPAAWAETAQRIPELTS